jgi:hypothetical protein
MAVGLAAALVVGCAGNGGAPDADGGSLGGSDVSGEQGQGAADGSVDAEDALHGDGGDGTVGDTDPVGQGDSGDIDPAGEGDSGDAGDVPADVDGVEPVACGDCDHEDDCRDDPCANEGELCEVAPYCEGFIGMCECMNGFWSCTYTDCWFPDASDADDGDAGSDDADGAMTEACAAPPPVCCDAGGAPVASVCSAGDWGCAPGSSEESCPSSSCVPPMVLTTDGCLTCDGVAETVEGAVQAAIGEMNACETAADCALVSRDTNCFGACMAAISAGQEGAFEAALDQIDEGYCQLAPGICGYSTPDCAPTVVVCTEGHCGQELGEP